VRSGTPPESITWYWQGAACGTRTDLGSGATFLASASGTYFLRARHNLIGSWSDGCGSVVATVPESPWVQLPGAGPAARANHAMAYDSDRGRVVLFGGWTGYSPYPANSTVFGDTWELRPGGWVQRSVTGPPARYQHAMAYDSVRHRTVLFGGTAFVGGPGPEIQQLADTWEWDGSSWTQRATTGPSRRYKHAMAFDSARGRVVLFGGEFTGGGGNEFMGDTWEWDGNVWTRRALSGWVWEVEGRFTVQHLYPGPGLRMGPSLAFDPIRSRTVLFGGLDWSTGAAGDTWEWDGSSWTLRSSVGPTGRWDAMLAYDSTRGRNVLYGGGNNSGSLGDTWEWDGDAWSQRSSSIPNARAEASLAYDAARGRVVLFGGFSGEGHAAATLVADTWALPSSRSLSLIRQPGPSTVGVHQSATFQVAAAGEPAVHYRWRRNGTALVNGATASGSTLSGVFSATLTLTDARAGDAGTYDCVLTNPCGTLTSAGAALSVVCRGDFNGDGRVDSGDVLAFIPAWLGLLPAADFNADGRVTVQDLLEFLGAWFAGC